MLNGILKVTPEELIRYSTTFGSCARQVNTKTNNMLEIVNSLCNGWQGEASSAYRRKFNTLRDDMNRMFKMIDEHSRELNEMGNRMKQTETNIVGNINGLAEDVIV